MSNEMKPKSSSFLRDILGESESAMSVAAPIIATKPTKADKSSFTELQQDIEILKMTGGKRPKAKRSKASKKAVKKASKKASKKKSKSSKRQLFRENGLAAFLKYVKTPIYNDMLKMSLSGVNVAILSGSVSGYYNRKARGELGESADNVEVYKRAYELFAADNDSGKIKKVIEDSKDQMAKKMAAKKAAKKAATV